MKVAALIRTLFLDEHALRLETELKPFFGDSVFFMIDRYRDTTIAPFTIEDHRIYVGRAFLVRNQLPWFDRVGWQCGDFIYYAAIEILNDYEAYWLIEDDVSFQLDTKAFFTRGNASGHDFLAPAFGPASKKWFWTRTLSNYVDGEIFGSLYPITRMTRRAATYLLQERIKYTKWIEEHGGREIDIKSVYANDEIFSANILKRGGFACESLNDWAQNELRGHFSFMWPVHPRELSFLSDKVAHPVCNGDRSREKFQSLANDAQRRAALISRFQRFSSRFGNDEWERFSGISASAMTGAEPT